MGGYYNPQPFPHYSTERSPTGAYGRGSNVPEGHPPPYPLYSSGGHYGGYNVPEGYPSTYNPSPPVSPMTRSREGYGEGYRTSPPVSPMTRSREGYGEGYRTYYPSPPISPIYGSREGYGGGSRMYNPSPPVSPMQGSRGGCGGGSRTYNRSPPVSPYSRPKVPEREHHNIEAPSFGYGQHPYGRKDMPPPPFRTQPTQEEQEAQFEADLQKAMWLSGQERINELQDEQRYNESLQDAHPRGRHDNEAGPSRGPTGKGKGKVNSDSDSD
jgi:hypothetical protein